MSHAKYQCQTHISVNLLDSKIDVLLDTKTEAARFAEVATQQLVLLHLQATFQELHGFLATNSHVASDLLITPDSKGTDSVPRCKILYQHLFLSML